MKHLKKQYDTLLALALSLLAVQACYPDDRNNFMVDDSFSFTATDRLQTTSVHTGSYVFGIAKNGKGFSSASAVISTDESDIASALKLYNLQNGTDYQVLPAQMYTLPTTRLEWSEKEVVKQVPVTWDVEAVTAYIGDCSHYVIPLRLQSNELEVNGEHNFLMVALVRSTLSLEQTVQPRTVGVTDFEPREDGTIAPTDETITLDVASNHLIPGVSMTIPVKIDNSLIPAFNAAQEDVFTEAPEGILTLLDKEIVMAAGKTDAQFKVYFDKKKLLDADGTLHEFPNYVIPVALGTDGVVARKGEESFELKGLGTGNTVCYFTVKFAQEGIADVSVVWGKYTASAAQPWYADVAGFTAGADRTLAMDDNFVYVAKSAASGGIYAFSRSNGAFVKTLPLGDAASNGSTFNVSCVRMIPNEAGDDILLFCSLKGENDHLKVYAYSKGIDADPVEILDYRLDVKPAPGVEDYRRYGDRFTVKGTWQNGELWFHTWHPDGLHRGKTVVFPLSNGSIAKPTDPLSYLIDGTDTAIGAAIRDVVIIPGWDQVMVTRPNGAAVFQKTDNDSDNGWIKWNKTQDMADFALTYGYNFFSYRGKAYIAYARLDIVSGNSGRLIIIENNAQQPTDFPSVLQAQEGYREYPIHGASFDTPSPIGTANSVVDCTVRSISGNTYVATLQQGGALTLYQLQ